MPAFSATFSDLKLVKTRQVAQLIFEIPIEQFDAAYEILGGVPVPGKERWFGIAAIKAPQQEESRADPRQTSTPTAPSGGEAREKMAWRELQPGAQAALRCKEVIFRAFLTEEHCFRPPIEGDQEEYAAAFLRNYFGIKSRSELGSDHRRRVLWKQMDDSFQAWKAAEYA
jgi:hypothetical protein